MANTATLQYTCNCTNMYLIWSIINKKTHTHTITCDFETITNFIIVTVQFICVTCFTKILYKNTHSIYKRKNALSFVMQSSFLFCILTFY